MSRRTDAKPLYRFGFAESRGCVGKSLSERTGEWRNLLSRRGIYPVLAAALAVLLLIQLVRLAWIALTPLGPVGDWRSGEVQVMAPESRLALFSSFDPFFRSDTAQTANVVTSLQLTLYGIRMNEGSGLGSAILSGPDGVQDSYAVGEEIMSGVTLDSVRFDHVVIDRGGVRESLYLDQSIPAQTVGSEDADLPVTNGGTGFDLSEVASFAPRSEDGRITGIVARPAGDGSLFAAAGFRSGDIIVSINGNPVSSTADIDNLQDQIRPGARLSVEVERGADTVPIVVNLGDQ